MKILLPVNSGAKKRLLYILIAAFSFGTVKAAVHENVAYFLAAGVGVSAVWALYERMSKNGLKKEADLLQGEVNSYKSGEHIKEYWANTLSAVTIWEKFLEDFKNVVNSNKTQGELAEYLINSIIGQAKHYNLTIDELRQKIAKGISDLDTRVNTLSAQRECMKPRSALLDLVEKALERTALNLRHLNEYAAFLEEQKAYVELLSFIEQGLEQEYAKEIEYSHVEIAYRDKAIDQIIKTKSNQVLFPYLFYAQDLKFKVDKLSKLLNNLSGFKSYPFQENPLVIVTRKDQQPAIQTTQDLKGKSVI
ncbi:unnamed protein product, partial [Didymodactylos carnosus]